MRKDDHVYKQFVTKSRNPGFTLIVILFRAVLTKYTAKNPWRRTVIKEREQLGFTLWREAVVAAREG